MWNKLLRSTMKPLTAHQQNIKMKESNKMKKIVSVMLVVIMLGTMAVPVLAYTPENDFPEDAIVIEVNTIDELVAVHLEHFESDYLVIVMAGPDICPEEATLALENLGLYDGRSASSLVVFIWITSARLVRAASMVGGGSGIMTIYHAVTGLRPYVQNLWNSGIRGTWTGRFCCCGVSDR